MIVNFLYSIISKYRIPSLFGLAGVIFLLMYFVSNFFVTSSQLSDVIYYSANQNDVSSETRLITVDIQGQIEHAGIYSLRAGSRVQDVIDLAGGLTENADSEWVAKNLNRAQVLQDGDKVYIPSTKESKEYKTTSENLAIIKININTSSQSQLESLPGVGEKTAEKIIGGRPFTSIHELVEKKILGQSTFEKIQDLISTL